MSLRVKSLLVFSGAMTLLFGVVLLLAKVLIEREFLTVEKERMLQRAERFTVDLDTEIRPVSAAVGDWAPWDELHAFVTGDNPAFVDANITLPVLRNLGLDFFAIYRQDGALINLSAREDSLAAAGVTRADLIEGIRAERLIPQHNIDDLAVGAMLAGRQIVLVAAAPIVRSDRSGAAVGTLVGGRVFGPEEIRKFEAFAGYRVEFTPEDHPHPPTETPTAAVPSVRVVDATTIEGRVAIFDTCGQRIATASLISGRPLHVQAERTVRIFVIGMASAAGILLFIVWYLLDSNVINPVQRLVARLNRATSEGRLPQDLGVTGRDEIAGLAHTIEDLARTVAVAEASYRAVVEDQIDFVIRYLPDGRILFANGAARRYFSDGQPDELYRRPIADLVAPEDAADAAARLAALTPAAPTATFEHRVRTSTGRLSWIRRTDRAIFDADGRVQELQCVAQDVTQARIIRKQLEASERRYRRLFETAVDGILILRQSNHMIADANPEFCRMLGLERSALLDRRPDALEPFRASRALRVIGRLLTEAGLERGAEISLPGADGKRRVFEVGKAIYEEEDGAVVQLNFRDITRRRQANDELRALSGRLMRLQDEERRRIARELHDSTAQNLSALQMAITHLDPAVPLEDARARSALSEIHALADLCVKEVRTISYLLHPPLLDEVGLLFALRWYVNGFMSRTEKIVRLDVPDTLDRLPSEIETAIFRIVQEALSNVHRHSGARRVWIRLHVENGTLSLTIRDDGRGLAPQSDAAPGGSPDPVLGVGIAGMRERLRQFGGALSIESSSRGTSVKATLPLQQNHGSAEL